MKKLLLVMFVGLVALSAAARSDAGTCPPQSRYGEWIKVKNKDGVITYRYVYRGFRSGFPPPAMYYYGYPQSGYTYGTGINSW
jgi:hypothetical protein